MTTINNSIKNDSLNTDNSMLTENEKKIKKTQLSSDDFMKLFLTQLKMQNPLKPFDNTAMLQQMAELGQLKGNQDLEKTINNLNVNLGKSQVLSASQLIGKHVQVPSHVSPLIDGEGLSGSVIVPQATSGVVVTISDSNNQVVKKIQLGPSGSGVVDYQWNGLDDQGNKLPADYYHVQAQANIDGQQTQAATAGTFRVNSVALNQDTGTVILNVEGLGGTKMNDVIKII